MLEDCTRITMLTRRAFLQLGLGGIIGSLSLPTYTEHTTKQPSNNIMKLRWKPYRLDLKHQFTIATSTRTTTPIVLTEVEYSGMIGYGEASLPPYLGETQESVSAFLSRVDLTQYDSPFELERILTDIDKLAPGNTAAKASIDIALHDLVGKLFNQPLYKLFGFSKAATPYTSYTIGIDTPEVVRRKTLEAVNFQILKVKLGKGTDKEIIEAIRSVSEKPIITDVNQGWNDKHYALEMIHWLSERNVLLVEQPLPKERIDDLAWVTERSPLPIIGDEGVQRLSDVPRAVGVYHGINIKLMKCTGLREALKMIYVARALGLKIMIGCMTETSCAISAAAQLSPLVDWADLDGSLLISNDIFDGVTFVNGKILIPDRPGIGVMMKKD